ncbi:MAG: threonine ammonia-lyase [Haloarculaceae archaeon]
MSADHDQVTYGDIEAAQQRHDDETVVKQTPVDRSTSLAAMCGADEVYLKMEHLQWTGSFKTRGAYNKISYEVEENDAEQFIAASAGNHAQGVALAATKCGADSTIVMPKTAPQTKIDATRGYGATVELVGHDFQDAMEYAQTQAAESDDAVFVHAYDDPLIVAGQGTLGVEMYEQCPDVDTVVVPIGGGGLIGGISTALDHLSDDVRVVGVQASGAETVVESLDKGIPQTLDSVDTIADGIATGGISELTLGLIQEHVDEVVTVSDGDIANAIMLSLERTKQFIEGAAGASIAAMLGDDLDVEGETVMPLLCGGNLDMTMLQNVIVHALTDRDQILRLRVHIDDRPGQMETLSGVIADHNANIQTVRHERAVKDLDVGDAYLVFQVETSGREHARDIIDDIEAHGYPVDLVN